MGDDVSLPVHPFLFMAVDTCLCVGRRVIAGSFFFRLGRLLAQLLFLIMLDLLGCEVSKILVAQAADEECTVDDIVVTQHAVQRQTQGNAVIVADVMWCTT